MKAMVLLILVLLASPADELDSLIRRLGDDEFATRERAGQELLTLLRERPSLRDRIARAVDEASDPEVVHRLRSVLLMVNWTATSPIPVPPRQYWMQASDGRRFALWGGRDRTGRRTDGAVFDGERWHGLPPAPVGGRVGAALHLTGKHLLVWGGGTYRRADGKQGRLEHYFDDGALYDLETGGVRPVPSAPIAGRVHARVFDLDGKVLVWGGSEDRNTLNYSEGISGHVFVTPNWIPDGAILDLKTLLWTEVPPSPVLVQGDEQYWDANVAWYDGKLLALFGNRHDAQMNLLYIKGAAAYDPSTNRWSSMPECPLEISEDFESTPVGVILWSGGPDTRHPKTGRLATFDGAWKVLPAPDVGGEYFGVRSGRLLVWNDFGDQTGSVFDFEEGSWTVIPKSPLGARQWTRQLWNGDELVIWGGGKWKKGYHQQSDGARWSVGEPSWKPIAEFPSQGKGRRWASSTAKGRTLIVWGGDTHERGFMGQVKEDGEYLDDALIYDAALDKWFEGPTGGPLSEWIREPEFTWLGGRLLILAPDASRAVLYTPDASPRR